MVARAWPALLLQSIRRLRDLGHTEVLAPPPVNLAKMHRTTLAASALLGTFTLVSGSCNADNCLRALRNPTRIENARAFCATYTAAPSPTIAIPSYATEACKANQVGDQEFRVSSACSCIATASPTVTVSSTATSSSSVTASPTAACAAVSSSWAAQKAANPAGMLLHALSCVCTS